MTAGIDDLNIASSCVTGRSRVDRVSAYPPEGVARLLLEGAAAYGQVEDLQLRKQLGGLQLYGGLFLVVVMLWMGKATNYAYAPPSGS